MAPAAAKKQPQWSTNFDTKRRQELFQNPPKDKTAYPTLAAAVDPHINSFNSIFAPGGQVEEGIKDIGTKSFADGDPYAPAEELGGKAVAFELDVTSRDSFATFLDAAESELGPVDVLINNAGIMPLGAVLKEPDSVTRAIIDVNVHGLINGTKAIAPGMVDRGRGAIVNVASAVGRVASPLGATIWRPRYWPAMIRISVYLRVVRGAGDRAPLMVPCRARADGCRVRGAVRRRVAGGDPRRGDPRHCARHACRDRSARGSRPPGDGSRVAGPGAGPGAGASRDGAGPSCPRCPRRRRGSGRRGRGAAWRRGNA